MKYTFGLVGSVKALSKSKGQFYLLRIKHKNTWHLIFIYMLEMLFREGYSVLSKLTFDFSEKGKVKIDDNTMDKIVFYKDSRYYCHIQINC